MRTFKKIGPHVIKMGACDFWFSHVIAGIFPFDHVVSRHCGFPPLFA
jgi:hypothetical protein